MILLWPDYLLVLSKEWPSIGSEAFHWVPINSWIDLDTRFLSRFYEDDTKVTMDKLLSTMQKKEESIRDYIEWFRNLSDVSSGDAIAHVVADI